MLTMIFRHSHIIFQIYTKMNAIILHSTPMLQSNVSYIISAYLSIASYLKSPIRIILTFIEEISGVVTRNLLHIFLFVVVLYLSKKVLKCFQTIKTRNLLDYQKKKTNDKRNNSRWNEIVFTNHLKCRVKPCRTKI